MERFNKLQEIAGANAAAGALDDVVPPERTTVRMASRRSQVDEGVDETPGPASLWLYLAGLCVTLSGLYAVNYGQEAPTFAMITYTIAIVGYVSSYLLRTMRVPYELLRLPLLVLVGLGLFAWLSSGQAEPSGDARTFMTDRSHAMQMLCVWIALLQTYAAASDAIVLFSCVPCMSLIALVSTTNPDTEVQYAFLVFVGAATFLMVHENYLRTRRTAAAGAYDPGDRKLFGGQVQLALGCVLAAFVLANVVAVPMHAFGRTLQLANGWGQLNPSPSRTSPSLAAQMANDPQTLTIGGGPVVENSTPVMQVQAAQGGNWRGTTYDYYTGRTFENHLNQSRHLDGSDETAELKREKKFHPEDSSDPGDWLKFKVLTSSAEPVLQNGRGARVVQQTVTVLFPGISQCYGIGCPTTVYVPPDKNVECTGAGSIFASSAFAVSSKYRVTSVAATDDEQTLRAASSAAADIPYLIADTYLQIATSGAPESSKLRRLTEQITGTLTNNYDKAVAIHNYLTQTCKYNLQAPAAPADSDRVEYFVLQSHQGYCDSFAAAMTILARYAGIPARVAAGYVMGEADGKGGFLVRQKDKHAWSELFFPGVGWVTFDATDTAQDVSDHTQQKMTKRANFVAWLFSHGWLPPLLLAAVIGLLAYLAWTELLPRVVQGRTVAADGTPAGNRAVIGAYLQACGYLDRRGLHRPRSATPVEFLAMVRPNVSALSPEAAEALATLTALHDRFRYGREAATDAEAQEATVLAATVKTALTRVSAKALKALPPVRQPA